MTIHSYPVRLKPKDATLSHGIVTHSGGIQLTSAEHLLQQITSHYISSPHHRAQTQTEHTRGFFRAASFQVMVSLFSPDYPEIPPIDKAGLQLRDLPVFASQTLGLKVQAITTTTTTQPELPLSRAFV